MMDNKINDTDIEELKIRFNQAKDYKMRWLALYQGLYQYVIPAQNAYNELFNYVDVGMPTNQQIWDETAMECSFQYANELKYLLIPDDRAWGKIELDPYKFDESEIEKWQPTVDTVNERVMFYLRQSNFSRAASSSLMDLAGGTGALWIDTPSAENPLNFVSIPSICVFPEFSVGDSIDNCFFTKKMSGREILREFPKYDGILLKTLYDNLNENYLVNYGQIKVSDNLYYYYGVLNDDMDHLLFNMNSEYKRLIVFRDRVRPGEVEGRGPGINMLPTIMDVNKTMEARTKSMDFKANPPLFIDTDTYFNPYSVRRWSGTTIPRRPGGRNPIEQMVTPDFPDVMRHVFDCRDRIRIAFRVDPLGEINSPVRTAEEISIREARAQKDAITDISRLINELPGPVFMVAAYILNNFGRLTKNAKKIPDFNPTAFRFVFSSPLMDIQKNAELTKLQACLQLKQQYFGEGAVVATANHGEMSEYIDSKLDIPSKLFKSSGQINQMMAKFSQMALQQQLPQSSTSASAASIPPSNSGGIV